MRLALDRASARAFDKDGHLHVSESNISKATINPYNGAEIPDATALGLDPNRVYRLLRDPQELAKAAATFAGKPLLMIHTPITANAHPTEEVVGAVMNPTFEEPYLKAEIVVWRADAIASIEDETQKELSSGYRYRADMTPGTYQGEAYDGVMRDIVGNHVTLVTEGRAGPDVVVGDSAHQPVIKETESMKHVLSRKAAVVHGALVAAVLPKIAQDHKMPDLSGVLAKITSKNFATAKPKIAADVKALVSGKIAKDANLEDLTGLLDALEQVEVKEGVDADPNSGLPMAALPEAKPAGQDATALEQIKTLLADLSDEDKTALKSALGMDEDESEDEDAKRKREAAEKEKEKTAMDAINRKVKEAVDAERANQARVRDAFNDVRPLVGDLHIAADSAEGVYKAVLDMKGVATEGVHASAYKAMVSMLPKASDQPAPARAAVAMDAASAASYDKMFPTAARIN